MKLKFESPPGISKKKGDERYVNVTGDTMTGDLALNTNKLILEDSNGSTWALSVNTDGALVTIKFVFTTYELQDGSDYEFQDGDIYNFSE